MDEETPKTTEEEVVQDPPQEEPVTPETVPTTEKSTGKTPWYKRKMILFEVLAGLLLLSAIGFIFVGGDTNNTADSDTTNSETNNVVQLAAAVGLVEGSAQHSVDATNWVDLAGGETVSVGEYVRTSESGRVVLLLDDGSAVRLDNDSSIQLSTSDSLAVEVTLLSGQVYSRVIEDGSRTFAVATDNERFEAQGTAFKTATDEDIDNLEVYQSKVKVESDDTEVEEGNKYDTKTKEKSDLDLDKLEDDDFLQWNKDRDKENDEFKDKLGVLDDKKDEQPDDEPETDPTASITLEGTSTEDGVKLTWSLNNTTSYNGFKIVRSKTDDTPTYGVDTSVYVSGGDTRSKVVDVDDGKTYFFRVCIYREGGTCDTYSNTVQITAPDNPTEPVEAGDVTLSIMDGVVSWNFDGTAPHGFKVVMNTDGEPVYPANSIKYVGPGSSSYELPDKPAGTYYVKVCKYTADSEINGGCTDYSNEVEYVVSE